MSTSWKERKDVVVLLTLAVVGIWGYVGYTLVTAMNDPADEVVIVSITESDRPRARAVPRSEYTYSGGFRDPFWLELVSAAPFHKGVEPSSTSGAASQPEPVEPLPPQIRLLGIVNRTATVELPTGEVVFVSRGDEVGGARVTAVSGDGIILRKDGKSYDFALQ